MILYHITKRKNVVSILEKGLIPAYRKGMNISGVKCTDVFLTNDVNKVIAYQCGRKWVEKHDAVVLKIDTIGLDVKPHKYRDGATYTLSDFEFVVKIVPKHNIWETGEIKMTEMELV